MNNYYYSGIILLSCGLFFLTGCGDNDKVREAGTPPSTLNIFYTCDTRGHIEPCGCSEGMAGGIARRMSFLKASDTGGASLLVDAGDVTAGARDWERFEARYILDGYQAMGYHAVNAGHREAQLSAEQLVEWGERYPFFLSTNLLHENGDPVLQPYLIVDFPDNYRIGILGVMEATLDAADLGEGLMVAEPVDAIASFLPELNTLVDTIVLLAFTDEEEMKSLATRFFEIDVIVGGNVIQPIPSPLNVNRSVLVSITDKGKAVGQLTLKRDADGEVSATSEVHMLLEDVSDDAEGTAIVDAFKKELANMDFQPHRDDEEGLTTITSARSKESNTYLTAESCSTCHPKAVEQWEASNHAHAFATLEQREHQYNPRCLQCHTVGYGSSDGFINERLSPTLKNVSCGNCHGRDAYHVRFHLGEDVPERAATLKSVQCETCHDEDNSINFNPSTYWEMINHGQQ